MKEHLDLKDFLLNPKMGNKATTWFYVDGLRLCDISIGRKYVFVKPLYGNYVKKMYWRAASTDAYYKALELGRKRKSKNWEKDYV